jgi:hypothetical protein
LNPDKLNAQFEIAKNGSFYLVASLCQINQEVRNTVYNKLSEKKQVTTYNPNLVGGLMMIYRAIIDAKYPQTVDFISQEVRLLRQTKIVNKKTLIILYEISTAIPTLNDSLVALLTTFISQEHYITFTSDEIQIVYIEIAQQLNPGAVDLWVTRSLQLLHNEFVVIVSSPEEPLNHLHKLLYFINQFRLSGKLQRF